MNSKSLLKNKFSKDLILVLLSNLVTLAGSIVSGMLIPKILGVEGFSYYNIYALYLTYTSMLHFGFVDGILLKYAGREYSELVGKKFRRFSRFYILFQTVMAAIVILLALIFAAGKYRMAFIFVGVNMLSINVISYYQYVSQDTMRFKELSARKVIQAALKIVLALALWLLVKKGIVSSTAADFYILGVIIIDLLLALWYIYTYRDITFGEAAPFGECRSEIFSLFKEGIFLTLSYWLSNLIYVLDKQVVSMFFDETTYGIYSFANKLIATASSFVLAIALVLFPRLKRLSKERIIETFPQGMAAISAVACGGLVLFQPLCLIIERFLGEYTDSIIYLKILFPGLVFMCCINIIISTYFNALNKQRVFFFICVAVLAVAAGLNAAAYTIFRTPEYISAALIVSLLILYIAGMVYFVKVYKVLWIRNLVYIILMIVLYYLSAFLIRSEWISFAAYGVAFIVITAIFYGKQLKGFLKNRKANDSSEE